jgi:hypothetical protein
MLGKIGMLAFLTLIKGKGLYIHNIYNGKK